MNFNSSIESISRVSPAHAKRLHKLGIKTIKDLLYHFPFRYEDLSKIVKIADLKEGEIATIHGEIINIKMLRTFKKKMWLTEALIKDDSGTIRAVWYNQPFLVRTFKKGVWISAAGKVNFNGKTLFFSNPAHEKIPAPNAKHGIPNTKHTGRLVPIYPETAKLTSKWLRYIFKIILPGALPQINEFLPEEIKKSRNLIGLRQAIEKIHMPKTQKDVGLARHRLGFEELFLIQLYVLEQKQKWKKNAAPKIKFDQNLIKKFVDSLPFKLTNAQRKAAWEILQDLEKISPMNRLLEGDVGSGKTIVAAIAALQAIKAGYQAAFMAPTEILAQQHFAEISKLFKNSGIKIGLLTGSEKKMNQELGKKGRSKKEAIDSLSVAENSEIIIGTHALIDKKIKFRNLGLVILDEQHRFGVQQRAALQKNIAGVKDKTPKQIPHLLSMTATPIPRTLALTIYGDLELSIINEMPKGRQKIITKIVAPENRRKAYDFIREQIKSGRQAFVICPRIDPSQTNAEKTQTNADIFPRKSALSPYQFVPSPRELTFNPRKSTLWDVKTVTEEYEKLSKKVFPDLKIAMLHGKLKQKEKEKIMRDFRGKKYDVLVSTSVVEVGVDIPNASVMMIEGAERFGLAQLYQFRGRVGRDKHQSFCFLFADSYSQTTRQRLQAIVSAKNGFELAEYDLKLRGPGEFWGAQQWGLPDLVMASLSDSELVKQCREEAEKLLDRDPELKTYPLLSERLKKFQQNLHLE